jgi:hypothetical protein
VYWRVVSDRHAKLGALPPEPADDVFGRRSVGAPVLQNGALRREAEGGRTVVPADCGPVRLISRFGFVARCPGEVLIRRLDEPSASAHREGEWASFGLCAVGGTRWPGSDSGFVASWLAGSEYAKIQTGVEILFDADKFLYQGPLPNRTVTDCEGTSVEIMAGLQYSRFERSEIVAGRRYGVAELNVVVKLPPAGSKLRLSRGMPLCWFIQTASMQSQTLRPLGTWASRQLDGPTST